MDPQPQDLGRGARNSVESSSKSSCRPKVIAKALEEDDQVEDETNNAGRNKVTSGEHLEDAKIPSKTWDVHTLAHHAVKASQNQVTIIPPCPGRARNEFRGRLSTRPGQTLTRCATRNSKWKNINEPKKEPQLEKKTTEESRKGGPSLFLFVVHPPGEGFLFFKLV